MAGNRLTILQINDVHGYLEPHAEIEWAGSQPVYPVRGGYARIATLIEEARRENPGAVVVLDNGDTFHGTYPVVHSKGEVLLPVLNALGLDGMTGHWDFAYGPQQLERLAAGLRYPFLACNCTRKESGEPAFRTSRVLERGGTRLGVIGLAALVDKMMPDEFSAGLSFSLGVQETAQGIDRLRRQEKADLVVVVSHLGFPQDGKLAGEVQGIDVLLSGHTHNRLYRPATINRTLIIQSGCHGSFVGRLDLEIDAGRISHVAHRLIPVDVTIATDPQVAAIVSEAMAPHRDMLSTVVGHAETGFDRGTILEASMDDLLLAAIAEASGTSLAFSNGWRYGAPIAPGPITLNDLWNMIPANPEVVTVELSGDEMRSMLEENLERTFARDPFEQLGGHVRRCRGLTMLIKIENPSGQRIQQLLVGREPVGDDRTYTAGIATPQAVPPRFGRNRRNVGCDAIVALQSYLRKHPRVSAGQDRSVIAV
jgi:2',3'-cyclic-nucleotide 2'-phosphodiesterase (5'-nucleotidase family)